MVGHKCLCTAKYKSAPKLKSKGYIVKNIFGNRLKEDMPNNSFILIGFIEFESVSPVWTYPVRYYTI